jgi:hypothetical protein
VAFGFFLVMLIWALWQIVIERSWRPVLLMGAGGIGAAVLLLPYLWELTHGTSTMTGGSVFTFALREMIPAKLLMATHLFQHLAIGHPALAENLAILLLLIPGYAIELGVYLLVLLIFLTPAWRGKRPLSPAHRSLLVIALAILPFITLIRSSVLESNDFGWRAALFLQYPLLLLASELLVGWAFTGRKSTAANECAAFSWRLPLWLRWTVNLAIGIGLITTICQALVLRVDYYLLEKSARHAVHTVNGGGFSHYAYISTLGYAELDQAIAHDAIVQYNPAEPNANWNNVDLMNVDHQTAMSTVAPLALCGSQLGGDARGCPAMLAAVPSLYLGATAAQARAICSQYKIQYLVARPYDAAWMDKNSWVWKLNTVIAEDEFRALDCR